MKGIGSKSEWVSLFFFVEKSTGIASPWGFASVEPKMVEKQLGCGCQNRSGIPFWGGCITHLRTYSSGDWDVHWGYDLDLDPWPNGWLGCSIFPIARKGWLGVSFVFLDLAPQNDCLSFWCLKPPTQVYPQKETHSGILEMTQPRF